MKIESFLEPDTFDSIFLKRLSEHDIALMLAQRERQQEGTPRGGSVLKAKKRKKAISSLAVDMIVDFETGGRAYYERVIKSRPCWPGGDSGVTIGFGYDIGYVSVAEFTSDWQKHLSTSDVDRLASGVGLRGLRARRFTADVLDIRISWDIGKAVFEAATLPKFEEATVNALRNEKLLHPHSLGALVSLVLNRGAGGFTSNRDRFREMVAIREHMKNKDFDLIPDEFRAMKRIWEGKGLDGLLIRRDAEADLFELGLDAERLLSLQRSGDDLRAAAVEADPDLLVTLPRVVVDELTYEAESPAALPSLEDIESTFKNRSGGTRYSTSDVYWPLDDANSPDYRHLPTGLKGQPFDLTGTDVDAIIRLNDFQPHLAGGKILIALRGAKLERGHEVLNQNSVRLVDVRPDHRGLRCVIGVYDQSNGGLSMFTASTVPNAGGVLKAYNHYQFGSSKQGNILPTGCYEYAIGTHYGSVTVPRVFRLGDGPSTNDAGEATVMRSANDVAYGTQDIWDRCIPKDNIHPAHGMTSFSSLGCLTVRGRYGRKGSTDQWLKLQQIAGTSSGKVDGTRFDLVLVTGLDIATVSSYRSAGVSLDPLRCLRHGSTGNRVTALQTALGLPNPDGKFGPKTKEALGNHQRAELGWSTGLYSADMDEYLGWKIF